MLYYCLRLVESSRQACLRLLVMLRYHYFDFDTILIPYWRLSRYYIIYTVSQKTVPFPGNLSEHLFLLLLVLLQNLTN